MSNVRVVTDSTAELSRQEIEELGITVVPWRVQLGAETLVDGPSLHSASFYRDTIRKRQSPVVIAPTVREFSQAYSQLVQETDDIVVIVPSSRLVTTVDAARQARTGLLGRVELAVVDSHFISRGLGVLVAEAARAARSGMSGTEVVRWVNGQVANTYMAFVVDSMDYLSRHGLAPDNSGIVGSAGFKPLLLLEEGSVVRLQRSRNRGTPVERLIEFVGEFVGLEGLSIVHSGLSPHARELAAALGESFPAMSVSEHIFGPVFSSLVGPTAVGVAIYDRPL